MINLSKSENNKRTGATSNTALRNNRRLTRKYKKLVLMGKKYTGMINEIYNPIDAANRFVNLALQNVGEGSQSRQFLLESKQGIRKTSLLLKKLNDYAREVDKEIRAMIEKNE